MVNEELWAMFWSRDLPDNVHSLRRVVCQLLIEVEALREAVIRLDLSADLRQHLRSTYRDTAYLSHNNAGPWPGSAKLLGLFFSGQQLARKPPVDFPEIGFMERLGYSREDLLRYTKEAEQAELFS